IRLTLNSRLRRLSTIASHSGKPLISTANDSGIAKLSTVIHTLRTLAHRGCSQVIHRVIHRPRGAVLQPRSGVPMVERSLRPGAPDAARDRTGIGADRQAES